MPTRNLRIEEDLIDQLFNSSQKRLARTLLLLARYGEPEASHRRTTADRSRRKLTNSGAIPRREPPPLTALVTIRAAENAPG